MSDVKPPTGMPDGSDSADAASANLLFAKRLIAQGDSRRAMKFLADSVAQVATPESLYLLAQLEMDSPHTQTRALEHLRQVTVMFPQFTDAWMMLANYWGLRGQPDKQKRCLEKVLVYDPKNRDARDTLELLLLNR